MPYLLTALSRSCGAAARVKRRGRERRRMMLLSGRIVCRCQAEWFDVLELELDYQVKLGWSRNGRSTGFQSAVAERLCGLDQKDSAGLAQALRIRPDQRIDTAFNEFDPEWNIRRTGDAGPAQP